MPSKGFKTVVRLLVVFALLSESAFAGLDSKKALYVGGTWSGIKERTEGRLDTSDPKVAKFTADTKAVFEIPFDRVTSLEYGQKAGRRVGATVALGVTTLGIGALPVLFSKKRKHYFSIGYTGPDGTNQGVVLELGKNITRSTLKVFETRSGKEIEFESEEAKKHIGN